MENSVLKIGKAYRVSITKDIFIEGSYAGSFVKEFKTKNSRHTYVIDRRIIHVFITKQGTNESVPEDDIRSIVPLHETPKKKPRRRKGTDELINSHLFFI